MAELEPQTRLEREHRQLRAVSLLAGLTIGLVFGLLVISPMQSAMRLEQDRLLRLEGISHSGEAISTRQAQLALQLAELRKRATAAAARIPRQPREDEFLRLLSEMARTTGLQVQDFRPMGIVPSAEFDQMQVRLSGQADYPSVCRFLDALRSASRMNRVTLLELGVLDAQRRRCSVDMTLAIYFNDRSSEPATAAAARPTEPRL